MVSIQNQLHDILFGHFWELSREDIFEIDKHFQRISLKIISDNFKHNLFALFLNFGLNISVDEAKPNILSKMMHT